MKNMETTEFRNKIGIDESDLCCLVETSTCPTQKIAYSEDYMTQIKDRVIKQNLSKYLDH